MPRPQRLPAGLARLAALLVACILVGQSLLGGVQLCAFTGAFGSECCAPVRASEAPSAAAGSSLDSSASAPQGNQAADPDCPCPFDCGLGCCAPSRALAPRALALDCAVGESKQLELPGREPSPPSPDARGILHVPKLAA
ncbi:MAG: hypothetical protein EOO73_16460 [Myxococcales bacterium]|nr:MAG: hypothetical protein EOO73_16460 [Myxococcales bacterium]